MHMTISKDVLTRRDNVEGLLTGTVFATRLERQLQARAKLDAENDYVGKRERLLDEALSDTFPASDPPSISMP